MTPNENQFNVDWHALKLVGFDVNSERETIEEDRWSYKRDSHYTTTIGAFNIVIAKGTLEGKICIPPDVIKAYEFNSAKEIIEYGMKEDMPNTLYRKIKDWQERKLTFNIKKCESLCGDIYEIIIEVEITGEVGVCDER